METEKALKISEYFGVPFTTLEETVKKSRKTYGISLLELMELGAVPSDFAYCLKVGGDVYEPVSWEMTGEFLGKYDFIKTKVPVRYAKRGEVVLVAKE